MQVSRWRPHWLVTARRYALAVSASQIQIEQRVVAGVPVEVRRSRRRRRSVQAFRDGERIVVQLPAALSRAETDEWVARMIARVQAKERNRAGRAPRTDAALAQRAADLSKRYLDGRALPNGIRWVTNQNARWGSCTPSTGQIRLSHRLQSMPDWVVDYVIVHELAHLLVAGHGPRFWALVDAYPRSERAQGFLEGVALSADIAAAWPRTATDGDTEGVECPEPDEAC